MVSPDLHAQALAAVADGLERVAQGLRLLSRMQAPVKYGPRIKAVPLAGKYAPVTVEVDGQPVTVAACVAEVLWDIACGVTRVKFRPETMRKLREVAPWIAEALQRDYKAQVLSNKHTYTVPAEVTRMVDGANTKGEPCKQSATSG